VTGEENPEGVSLVGCFGYRKVDWSIGIGHPETEFQGGELMRENLS
jgi:hypothetical protein